MNATELRIGNFVEVENYKIIQLENIHSKGTTKGDEQYLISMLKAIPLTEEWLLKFGFEKNNEYIVGAGICWYFKHPEYKYKLSETFRLMLLGIDLKYVHQLQNLYFALCGEELTVKH